MLLFEARRQQYLPVGGQLRMLIGIRWKQYRRVDLLHLLAVLNRWFASTYACASLQAGLFRCFEAFLRLIQSVYSIDLTW